MICSGYPATAQVRGDNPAQGARWRTRRSRAWESRHRVSARAPDRPSKAGVGPRPPPAGPAPGCRRHRAELRRFPAECIQRRLPPTPRSCCPRAKPGPPVAGRAGRSHERNGRLTRLAGHRWNKAAVAAVGDDRDLLAIAAEVRDERGQVRSHPFSVAWAQGQIASRKIKVLLRTTCRRWVSAGSSGFAIGVDRTRISCGGGGAIELHAAFREESRT